MSSYLGSRIYPVTVPYGGEPEIGVSVAGNVMGHLRPPPCKNGPKRLQDDYNWTGSCLSTH